MKPFRKLLVPFDGSPQSKEAAAYAFVLAERYEASMLFLFVDHPLTYALVDREAPTALEQLAELRATLERERTAARNPEANETVLQIETLVQRGHPVTEILRAATEGCYDLIVMGTKSRTGAARTLIGSVTESVIRHAPCPVLTVRSSDEG
jgi:nucleotide-binding universal stress UspA family protein